MEPGFSVGERGCYDAPYRGGIARKLIRPRRGCFHQQLPITSIAHPVHEAGHRVIGGFVGGDARLGKELPRRSRGMLGEPGGDYVTSAQHARLRRANRIDNRTGGLIGPCQRRRAVEHHDRIDPRVADQRRKSIAIPAAGLSSAMSIGLPWLHVAGRRRFNFWSVSCDNSAIWPPAATKVSAARMPTPPLLVRIATRSPACSRVKARVSAASNNSAIVATRNIPARRNAASKTASAPATGSMRVTAARVPTSER